MLFIDKTDDYVTTKQRVEALLRCCTSIESSKEKLRAPKKVASTVQTLVRCLEPLDSFCRDGVVLSEEDADAHFGHGSSLKGSS
jgi:hypothetical protein